MIGLDIFSPVRYQLVEAGYCRKLDTCRKHNDGSTLCFLQVSSFLQYPASTSWYLIYSTMKYIYSTINYEEPRVYNSPRKSSSSVLIVPQLCAASWSYGILAP
eukprot:jgi/Botrbrau1/14231/Bobra.0099s0006.1